MQKPFLSDKDIMNLKNHKYVGGEYTYIDNKMNHFWFWIVNLLPSSLSPNMITFAGNFTFNTAITLFLIFDSNVTSSYPSYLYFLAAFVFFFYQTMDAVDGKQARRTNKASPLGQLVDHGSDCLTATFINFNAIAIFGSGNNNVAGWFLFTGLILVFYVSNWAEHFTGILITAKGNIGVTEVQFLFMILNILSGLFGVEMWHYKLLG